ncbi:hypothetical protein SLE2022_124210 [Rubroshorea leprosula]
MEHFPVEVIGNILSHFRTARGVVVASVTCKKWREAFPLSPSLSHILWGMIFGSFIIVITQSIEYRVSSLKQFCKPRGYGVYHSS